MNLTDRIYLAVHVFLTLLVCWRPAQVEHWPYFVIWNLCAIAAILLVSRQQNKNRFWEFLHDWLPLIFFVTVFEEVSFVSLALRGEWQNAHLMALESAVFATPPADWLGRFSNPWLTELLEFGYFTYYPLYPLVAGTLWIRRRRPAFARAFRSLTDAISVGYCVCYATYLLFPTRSPSHNAGLDLSLAPKSAGPFHALVRGIQSQAGVHGNAFPSAHIMLAFVVLVFVFRDLPRLAVPLLVCVLLMSVAAVYDGYHYGVDVLAGAVLGTTAGLVFAVRSQTQLQRNDGRK